MLDVVFRDTANIQLIKAKAWYDKQRPGLGAEFARSLESSVNRIARNPFAAPAVYEDVRRVLFKRFPYSIYYLVQGDTLIVLSCLHTRRAAIEWSEIQPNGTPSKSAIDRT